MPRPGRSSNPEGQVYMEIARGIRKTRVGMVVSDKMDKTVVVEVKRLVAHPLYHKIIRRRVKIKAHDPLTLQHRG